MFNKLETKDIIQYIFYVLFATKHIIEIVIVVVFKGIMMMDHPNYVNNAHKSVHNAQIKIHVHHVVHIIRHYHNAETVRMAISKMLVYVNNVITHARLVLHNKHVYLISLNVGLNWILIIYAIHASLDILQKVIIVNNAQINAKTAKEYQQIA